jgi:hypothetical protein
MELQFVACQGDSGGENALRILNRAGYSGKTLQMGETTPVDSIAVFSLSEDQSRRSPGKYLRCSAIKLLDGGAPEWVTTLFRVGVIRQSCNWPEYRSDQGFEQAVLSMASDYEQWLNQPKNLVPWASYESDPSIGSESQCMVRAQAWVRTSSVEEMRRIWLTAKRASEYQVETIELGEWNVNCSREERVFPADAIRQAQQVLAEWPAHFAREATWAHENLQVPSVVVRLDCIIRDGQLIVYEVEERPAGLGVCTLVNTGFEPALRRAASAWPEFQVVVSPKRRGTDDRIWTERLGWSSNPESGLVLVRAEPDETEFHELQPQSVSSLITKGDKSYGEGMGLWDEVRTGQALPWERSFVLKPLQGSKLMDVEIWDPEGRPGGSKQRKIEEVLARSGSMFMQRMYPPMETGIPRFPWMIYRVFFTFHPETREWTCIGGNWNARHNLRIHGASDAIFGPLVPE